MESEKTALGGFTFFVLFKGPYLVSLNLCGITPPFQISQASQKALRKVRNALEEYFFHGRSYPDLKELLLEVPPFSRQCLETLRRIPRGEVHTYSWLAQEVGHSKALRAVGQALARNPLPLFYPCHRIVGKKGLGGFSAGLEWKRFLLRFEGLQI